MRKITVLFFAVATLAGCGLLKKTGTSQSIISSKQIDTDLHFTPYYKLKGNSVKERDGDYETAWEYKKDNLRCFAPNGDEDKFTESTADIHLNIGEEILNEYGDPKFLYGKILLHYKKENDKWNLEEIDSKDLRTDKIPTEKKEEISKFTAQKIEPLCSYYGVVPDLKK